MDATSSQRAGDSSEPLAWLLAGPPLPIIAEVFLLGARAYAGVTIASAGLDKLPTPDWMTDQVTQVGFPAPAFFAIVACMTEFIAGLLLVAGVFTRIMSALLAFTMGVAAFGFHRVDPILGMHITQGFFWLFVVFLVLGGGRLSVDTLIHRRATRRVGIALGLVGSLGMLGWGAFLQFRSAPPAPATPEPVEITAVSVPGAFNDWDLSANTLEPAEGGVWVGVFELPAGPTQFKFAANGSWDINLGESDQGSAGFPIRGTGEPSADNISLFVPDAGRVRFELNTETNEYTVTPAE